MTDKIRYELLTAWDTAIRPYLEFMRDNATLDEGDIYKYGWSGEEQWRDLNNKFRSIRDFARVRVDLKLHFPDFNRNFPPTETRCSKLAVDALPYGKEIFTEPDIALAISRRNREEALYRQTKAQTRAAWITLFVAIVTLVATMISTWTAWRQSQNIDQAQETIKKQEELIRRPSPPVLSPGD